MNNLKLVFSLLFVFVLFSCSEKEFLNEEVNQVPPQEFPADVNDGSFVSSEQAVAIAGKYLSSESGIKTRSLENASVEMVRDEKNGGIPAMYAVSYPEGGWVITSATRNYFPVLAYSDEGTFDMEAALQSGVSVWMAEVKDAVRLSETLADSTKAQIRMQWLAYEEAKTKAPANPKTRGYAEMYDRIDQLSALYPYTTTQWQTGTSLLDAYGLDFSTRQNLIDIANSLGSPPEYTIVVVRQNTPSTYIERGPWVTTKWHQGSPYNYFAPTNVNGIKYPAGCSAIAVASIMKYHEYPDYVNFNGFTINWDSLPDNTLNNGNTTTSVKALIRGVADGVNMQWGIKGLYGEFSWATPRAVKNWLGNIGYNVNRTDHNSSSLNYYLLHNTNPVLMVGNNRYLWPLPSPLDLLGEGHYWVCSGLEDTRYSTEYFVEFYNGFSYYNSSTSPSNPGISTTIYNLYYMNWGWGPNSNGVVNDGWYSDSSSPKGYAYARQNFYISE